MTKKIDYHYSAITSKLSLFLVVLTISAYIALNLFEVYNYAFACIIGTAFSFLTFILNKLRYNLLARIVLILTFCSLAFFYSNVYGENSSLEFFFIAILGMLFFTFSIDREKKLIILLSSFILIQWGILYFNNFSLFELKQINSDQKKYVHLICVLSLSSVIIFQLFVYMKSQTKYFYKIKKIKKEALKSSEDKIAFLNTMSHEIRTPLNAINGLAFILKNEKPEAYQINDINELEVHGIKLIKLLNKILDFSKYQTYTVGLDKIPCDINNKIKETTKLYKKECEEKNIDFKLVIDKNIPPVLIDIKKFMNVIDYLFYNALKFTTRGRIILKIKKINTNIHGKTNLEVSIKDTGLGLSRRKKEEIIDINNNVYNLIKDNRKIGLGIPLSKHILNLMNSQIYLESKLGLGSTFSFKLELDNAAIQPLKPTTQKSKTQKILVVDDNNVNLLVARQILEKENFNVTEASNGKDALEHMSNTTFDLVLMDIQMPIMNGFEATTKIRKFDKKTPIFALSASVLSDLKEEIKYYGFNGLILKPFDPKKLIETLKNTLNNE